MRVESTETQIVKQMHLPADRSLWPLQEYIHTHNVELEIAVIDRA